MKGSRNQRGFLLPLTLIVLAAGSVIVIAMLSFTSATARSSGQFSDEVPDRFTAEAGMTDILADLIRGSDILDLGYTPPGTLVNEKEVVFDISLAPTSTAPASLYQYVDPGVGFALKSVSSQTSTYFRLDSVQPGSHIRVNWSFTPSNQRWKVKVYDGGGPPSAPAPVILAADDFESGNFSGGSGWLGAWTTSGDATVVSSGGPHGGTYHAQLQRGTGVMTRSVNLSGQSDVRWRFWAKADSFESGETATCSVSSDGVLFTVVRVWVDGEDENVYRYEDIDLSSFAPYSADFRFRCQANMSGVGDLFWIDDMQIVSQAYPPLIAEFSDTSSPGGIFVDGSLVTGGAYTIEFFNNSSVDFVSDAFSISGSAANTWVFAQAYKDYLVTATAESSTIAAFIRQVPGPTFPVTGQAVYIYSWREP